MKLKYNEQGAVGGKLLAVLVIGLVVAVAYFAGVSFELDLPFGQDLGEGEYERTVVAPATATGMKVPINIRLKFYQGPKSNQADIDCKVEHRHVSSDCKAPVPETVTISNFNTEVGDFGDGTIYAINGDSFIAGKTTYGEAVRSASGVNFGPAQREYKVWTTDTEHKPSLSSGNHVIILQMLWEHYVRNTEQLLGSDAINLAIYYKIPDYNDGDSWTKSFTYWCYVPFDDFARAEDIRFGINAYTENAVVTWKEVKATKRVYWEWKVSVSLWSGISIKLVRQVDTEVSTRIEYHWEEPKSIPIDNGKTFGSHQYTYKIR